MAIDEPVRRLAAVTGATGHVGVNLVAHLCEQGWRVRAISRNPIGKRETGQVERIAGDVRDAACMRDAFQGVDIVFHLAARITLASEDPEAWDINVRGPATVAAAALAAGVSRMVHCSSVHSFDLARARPRLDEKSIRATDPSRPLYDRSKFAGEIEVRRIIDQGLDATIVNPTGIIGPIDVGTSRTNQIITTAARGRLPVVAHGGFDWVDVRDVVTSLEAAAHKGRTGENYLLAGHRSSVLYLARLAAALNGHFGPLIVLPSGLARWAAPLGERISRRFDSDLITPASIGALIDDPVVDGDKARRELGHDPRPLEDSVRDTVRWFSRHADSTS